MVKVITYKPMCVGYITHHQSDIMDSTALPWWMYRYVQELDSLKVNNQLQLSKGAPFLNPLWERMSSTVIGCDVDLKTRVQA